MDRLGRLALLAPTFLLACATSGTPAPAGATTAAASRPDAGVSDGHPGCSFPEDAPRGRGASDVPAARPHGPSAEERPRGVDRRAAPGAAGHGGAGGPRRRGHRPVRQAGHRELRGRHARRGHHAPRRARNRHGLRGPGRAVPDPGRQGLAHRRRLLPLGLALSRPGRLQRLRAPTPRSRSQTSSGCARSGSATSPSSRRTLRRLARRCSTGRSSARGTPGPSPPPGRWPRRRPRGRPARRLAPGAGCGRTTRCWWWWAT